MEKNKLIYKKIEELIPYAQNARTHSSDQLMQIADSIKEFGFTNPVLVDEGFNIIAGHGRVLAADMLSLIDVPCIILKGLSEVQKKAYVIADNKLALNASWDEQMLINELKDLDDDDYDLDILGFSDKELDRLLADPDLDIEPEIKFTEELLEENNYLVLFVDNSVDWLQVETLFELESVKALDSRKGYEKKGVGRVVNATKLMQKMLEVSSDESQHKLPVL